MRVLRAGHHSLPDPPICPPCSSPQIYGLWVVWAGGMGLALLIALAMQLRRQRARQAGVAALVAAPSKVRRQASRLQQASSRALKDADVALAAVGAGDSGVGGLELEQLLEQEVAAAAEAHARLAAVLAAVRQAKLASASTDGSKE